MKTVELTGRSTAKDVLPKDQNEEILVVRGGHAVALVMPFDDDDAEWYARERNPEFIDSIKRAREQVNRGETVTDAELDSIFADNIDGIDLSKFSSPLSIETLQRTKCAAVPSEPGVYVVLRPHRRTPRFLEQSVGGWFKGRDPSYTADVVRKKWIDDAMILYIGKGDGTEGLKRRLRELMDYGLGKAVGHEGGRLIWHLQNHQQLLVRWLAMPAESPLTVEKSLLAAFRQVMGERPFANHRG